MSVVWVKIGGKRLGISNSVTWISGLRNKTTRRKHTNMSNGTIEAERVAETRRIMEC